MKDFVREYIHQRFADVRQDPILRTIGRITLSDVFYDLRKPMEVAGWEKQGWNHPKKRRREKVQVAYIKEVCDELGITRASIGIIVGEAAHMYFRGNRYSVGIDELTRLKKKGVVVLIIEKEGIAEQLRHLAAPYGIALVHTRGFLTEYAEDLSQLINNDGGNIAILTDFDISGMTIAFDAPKIPRIGIDFDTLIDLEISDKQEELEEVYTPDQHHLMHIENIYPDLKDLEYLKTRRIEINSVRRYVGSERLWKWIISKLEDLFDHLDYNRAIRIPTADEFRPDAVEKLNDLVDKKIGEVLSPEIERRGEQLSHHKGFIDDIDRYESEMFVDFQYKVVESADTGSLIENIEKVITEYSKDR